MKGDVALLGTGWKTFRLTDFGLRWVWHFGHCSYDFYCPVCRQRTSCSGPQLGRRWVTLLWFPLFPLPGLVTVAEHTRCQCFVSVPWKKEEETLLSAYKEFGTLPGSASWWLPAAFSLIAAISLAFYFTRSMPPLVLNDTGFAEWIHKTNLDTLLPYSLGLLPVWPVSGFLAGLAIGSMLFLSIARLWVRFTRKEDT